MSTDKPSHPVRRRRWIVCGLVLLPLALVALTQWRQEVRAQRLVSDIEAAHGAIIRETSVWDRWVGKMVQESSGTLMYRETDGAIVRLDGQAFDNSWLRNHDYLRELPISTLTLNNVNIRGMELAQLVGSHPLRELYAAETELSPEVFDRILQQRRLKLLHLRGASLKDEQFVRLPLEQLEQLYVELTDVTPNGLRDLSRCDRLGCLGLDGRQLDEATAASLAEMPRLLFLNVVGRDVTDTHAELLHAMPQLHRLILVDTSISPQGLSHLRLAIPDTIVESL
jgi:hypothetical protein